MKTEYEGLMSVFIEDADQRLGQLETSWHALSDGSCDPECKEKIARAAHTIKGNAAMMGLPELSAFAGRVEHLANGLRRHSGTTGIAVVWLLRECIDRIHQMVRSLKAGRGDVGQSDRALLAQIEYLSAQLHDGADNQTHSGPANRPA